jgi:hypothetical protein
MGVGDGEGDGDGPSVGVGWLDGCPGSFCAKEKAEGSKQKVENSKTISSERRLVNTDVALSFSPGFNQVDTGSRMMFSNRFNGFPCRAIRDPDVSPKVHIPA